MKSLIVLFSLVVQLFTFCSILNGAANTVTFGRFINETAIICSEHMRTAVSCLVAFLEDTLVIVQLFAVNHVSIDTGFEEVTGNRPELLQTLKLGCKEDYQYLHNAFNMQHIELDRQIVICQNRFAKIS